MRQSYVHVLLRYPLLALIYLFIGVDLVGYLGVRLVVIGLEWATTTSRYRQARRRLAACTTHAPEYVDAARALDQLMGLGEGADSLTAPIVGGVEVADDDDGNHSASSPSSLLLLERAGDAGGLGLRTTALHASPPSEPAGRGRPAHFDEALIRQHIAQLRRCMGRVTAMTRALVHAEETGDDSAALTVRRSRRLQEKAIASSPPPRAPMTRASPDIPELVSYLRSCCKSNLGGIENESLFSVSFSGRSELVDEYVACMEEALDLVASSPALSPVEKFQFFKRTSTAYGRAALCLSGGARMAFYHLGTAKALFESDLLPNIITGTSGGSLIAAILCVRTDEELRADIFTPTIADHLRDVPLTLWEKVCHFWRHGTAFPLAVFLDLIQWYTKGPTTFLEAYQATGRILNISVVSSEPRSPPKLLNYLTAPDVLISSAVLASSAIPGVIPPVMLMQKTASGALRPYLGSGTRWRDGSLKEDIPGRELHRQLNVTYTIVSQVNPHITAFFFNPRGSAGDPSPTHLGLGWRGGFISAWLVQHYLLDLQKWLTLIRDMDMLPHIAGVDYSTLWLQKFEGSVTIMSARNSWRNFRHLFSIPTERADLADCLAYGSNRTFAKLPMISSRMRVERRLGRYRRWFGEAVAASKPAPGPSLQLDRCDSGMATPMSRASPRPAGVAGAVPSTLWSASGGRR